jgi:hypothetical protein
MQVAAPANVLQDGKDPGYWIATIGTGNLEGPVNAVLFVIRVQGKPGDYVKGGKLRVTVGEAGKFVLNRELQSGVVQYRRQFRYGGPD